MGKIFDIDNVPVLETSGGKLKGYFYKGEYIYKGVPYATARRFHKPKPAVWKGVKEASSYGFVCPLMDNEKPNSELLVPHRYWPMDENCQFLNIWTRELDPQGEKQLKKPVVVWLHGGGYFAGSSIEQLAYDGFNLCMEGDVVVVSLNHRLNILGYMDLSAFGEEYEDSANAGHEDMIAALKWVHDNIALFGGDPDNVTLFGQSGGGMKILDLIQMPAADGLFNKGLVMSGVANNSFTQEASDDGSELVKALMAELGFSDVKELETVPYYELCKAYKKVSPALMMAGKYTGNSPRRNAHYMGDPLLHGFRDRAYDVKLMIGSVYGEFAFAPAQADKKAITENEAIAMLEKIYKDGTKKVVAEYKKAYPDKYLLDLALIDRCMRQPSVKCAKLHAAGGGTSYMYLFTTEFPIQGGKAAWHCSDIPFVFHNIDLVEVCDFDGAKELESKISGAFLQFAKTGDPGISELPAWPAVSKDSAPVMIYDTTCQVKTDFDDKLFEEIDKVLPPFNLFAMIADEDIQH